MTAILERTRPIGAGAKTVIAVLTALVYIGPFYLIVVNAFKTRPQILTDPVGIPPTPSLANFGEAADRMDFVSALFNSVLVTAGALLLLVIFPAMFAYFLSRFDYRINKLLFGVLVASMIIPFQALMIPFVSIYGRLGMLNSRLTLVYFYLGFGVALSTFLYHGFISTISTSLDEAAILDGASRFQVFWYVIMPLLKPITATVMILNALWVWNDFLLPSLVLFQDSRTIPLSTFSFFGRFTTDYGLALAGLVLSVTPIVIFYLVMQRNMIRGITDGAVK